MIEPPRFKDQSEYRASLGEVDFWRPYIEAALRGHDLFETGVEPVPGHGGTYPTFILGDLVLKMLGYVGDWGRIYGKETRAHAIIAGDESILVPSVLGTGQLFKSAREDTWPYLITRRVEGLSWNDSEMDFDTRVDVARQLGEQLARGHDLEVSKEDGAVEFEPTEYEQIDFREALRKSCLPGRFEDEVNDFVRSIKPGKLVFLHSDLIGRHVFVDDGRLTGIIDWGDALCFDRAYELSKLFLDMFSCDKRLLKVFLEASSWEMEEDFPRRALAMACVRQAHGVRQHLTFDTFYRVDEVVPLAEVGSLDELATALFAV